LRKLADQIGISSPFLSDIELGRRFPSEESLAKLADALDVSPEELKQYDTRGSITDLKRLVDSVPKLGFAFRTVVEKIKNGELTADGADPGESVGKSAEQSAIAEAGVRGCLDHAQKPLNFTFDKRRCFALGPDNRGTGRSSIGLSGIPAHHINTSVQFGRQYFNAVDTGIHGKPIFQAKPACSVTICFQSFA
jgi:transcriptional regulator with XRE-family HTH domain